MSPPVSRRKGKTIDLRIDSIAAGGDGVGRYDSVVVFVPRTAPGDLVRVRAEQHDRLMRGRVVELLSPSPLRVEPVCKHYVVDRCGGCQLQHLRYEAQLDAKARILHDSLARIGGLQIDALSVDPSDKPFRYRRKLTLALRRKDRRWIAGLHRFDAADEVFELQDCSITREEVLQAWSLVLAQQKLFPKARELRGAVRLLPSGFSFALEGGSEWRSHSAFFKSIPQLGELWWKPAGKSRRLLHSREAKEYAGASFAQVNPDVAAKLSQWVVSLAAAAHARTAIDAYAGTGDIAVALAGSGTRVTAIEIDRDAARVCASRLPDGSRVIAAPVEDALTKALPADIVVLNPPRAGLDQNVASTLRAISRPPSPSSLQPKAIIYVSCNPATLARDIRRMEGYRVSSIRSFDMFPQTAHVETVCELVPAG